MNLQCDGILNRMVLSILFFSLEMTVNRGWSGSNLVIILFLGLWCNEDFGYSFVVAAEEFEAAVENRSAWKSPVLQLARISWCVALLLGQDSEMAFSHRDYWDSADVTRAHQRMRIPQVPGVWEPCIKHRDFSWEWNSLIMAKLRHFRVSICEFWTILWHV